MRRLVFIVEGQTELEFIQNQVIPYFYGRGYTNPMNAQKITTNRQANKKGGVGSFDLLRNEVQRVAAPGDALITTLLDFFRLPSNFPGYTKDSHQIGRIEQAVREAVDGVSRDIFFPYIQRHELESLMFTSLDALKIVFDREGQLEVLQSILDQYSNPEDINSGSDSSPSKRLLQVDPKYDKVLYGGMILEASGIDAIRCRCPRFDAWMGVLEVALGGGSFPLEALL